MRISRSNLSSITVEQKHRKVQIETMLNEVFTSKQTEVGSQKKRMTSSMYRTRNEPSLVFQSLELT